MQVLIASDFGNIYHLTGWLHMWTYVTGWWFGTFFILPHIGNNHPNWLIFCRGVQTTNQVNMYIYIHIHIHIHTFIFIYIHVYGNTEKENIYNLIPSSQFTLVTLPGNHMFSLVQSHPCDPPWGGISLPPIWLPGRLRLAIKSVIARPKEQEIQVYPHDIPISNLISPFWPGTPLVK